PRPAPPPQDPPPLAKQAAGPPADEDERPEHQQVGVHHPLLAREAAPERLLDRGQRDGDHGGVHAPAEGPADRGEQRDALRPRHFASSQVLPTPTSTTSGGSWSQT